MSQQQPYGSTHRTDRRPPPYGQAPYRRSRCQQPPRGVARHAGYTVGPPEAAPDGLIAMRCHRLRILVLGGGRVRDLDQLPRGKRAKGSGSGRRNQ